MAGSSTLPLALCLFLLFSVIECMLFSPLQIKAPSVTKTNIKVITSDDDDFKVVRRDRRLSGYAPDFASTLSSCTEEYTFVARRGGSAICGSADVEIVTLCKSWGSKDKVAIEEEIIRLPFIKNVLTNPQYRNMGVATDLLKYIEEHYRQDYDYLYLHVLKSNMKALNLYRKIDFEEVRLDDTCASDTSSARNKNDDVVHKESCDKKGSWTRSLKEALEPIIDPFIFPRPRLLMRKKIKTYRAHSSTSDHKGFTNRQILLSIENRPPRF